MKDTIAGIYLNAAVEQGAVISHLRGILARETSTTTSFIENYLAFQIGFFGFRRIIRLFEILAYYLTTCLSI